MQWDIKYRNGKNTIKEIIEKSKKINHGIHRENIIIDDTVYWHKDFPEYKRKYLKDYPNSNKLFKYHDQQKRTNEYLENNIEDSNKKLRLD